MRKEIKLLLIFVIAVVMLSCGGAEQKSAESNTHTHESAQKDEKKSETWTCSMHPNVRQPEKGKCPICAMDLIPLTDEDSGDAPVLKLSNRAAALAEIETYTVAKGLLPKSLMLSGRIVTADTGIKSLTLRFPGRVDKVFVKYEGAYVRKGMPLVKIYSPSLITSEQEFLTVAKASKGKGQLYNAALNRLLLLGITKKQIKALLRRGKPSPWITIYSTIEGYVKELSVIEGDYLKKGNRLFVLADLETLWGEFDVYGADLKWIRYGQKIVLESEEGKGRVIEGRISFVQPFFDKKSRVAKVRAVIKNRSGLLKPGMFIRGRTGALMDGAGNVYDEELSGNWISPVYPEIISDKAGVCSLSGAPLVKTEKYGYIDERGAERVVMIPDSAPLITGKRAVVYVASDEDGKYEGREVVLGRKGDGFYEVVEGVKNGDQVVVKGAFKLDSELQIKAKPSMMSRSGNGTLGPQFLQKQETVFIPESVKVLAGRVVRGYFPVQQALADDDFDKAISEGEKLKEVLKEILAEDYPAGVRAYWLKRVKRVNEAVHLFVKADSIEKSRVIFEELTLVSKI